MAGVRIWKLVKPKLRVVPVAGGSLVDGTTYYITAMQALGAIYQTGLFSAFADIITFTADATNKSFKIYHYVDGIYSLIEDIGGGKLRITAPDHNLINGSYVKFNDGVYNGTYQVYIDNTIDDYNHFRIQTAYLGNTSGTWTQDREFSSYIGVASAINFYVYTTSPYSAELGWHFNISISQGNHWVVDRFMVFGGTTTVPTISTLPTGRMETGFYEENFQITRNKLPSIFPNDKGKLYIKFYDTGTALTQNDLINELQGARGKNFDEFYSYQNLNNTIWDDSSNISVNASFDFSSLRGNAVGSITFTAVNLLLYGNFTDSSPQAVLYGYPKVYFRYCNVGMLFKTSYPLVQWINSTVYGYRYDTSLDSVYFENSILNFPRLYTSLGLSNTPLKNVQINSPISTAFIQITGFVPYNSKGENLTLSNIKSTASFIIYLTSIGDTSTIENPILDTVHWANTNNNQHLQVWGGGTSIPPVHWKIIDCTVDKTNYDKKIECLWIGSLGNVYIDSYYRVNFQIKNENNALVSNVNVSIADSVGNNYSGTTDANGLLTLKVKGYEITNYRVWNTTFAPYTVTITKDGYQDMEVIIDKLYKPLNLTPLVLKEVIPPVYIEVPVEVEVEVPVYYHQQLEGSIEDVQVNSSISEELIYSVIDSIKINGKVEIED